MAEGTIRTAIGLMSGTSLDGVDAALIRTDGEDELVFGPTLHRPYTPDLKATINRAIKAAREGRDGADVIGKATGEITQVHRDVVEALLEDNNLHAERIDVIGFHGQTIFHRSPNFPIMGPEDQGRTWQIGDGECLARETGIDTVFNFRAADVMLGGEGAPLAPVYHAAMVRKLGRDHPVGVLNLGGVGNITYVPADGAAEGLLAFDCGPGNGLIDEWMQMKSGETMDKDGACARRGKVHTDVLRMMLLAPYMRRKPPKSLDRYDFKLDHVLDLALDDGAATLTAFSAACVRASEPFLPEPVGEWIVCGGGRHNAALMEALGKALSAPVVPAQDVGWRGDDLEAECFAYLAVRALRDLPISFPKTTRAPHALRGGVLCRAPK
ncbi:MAG: anhydro-N-acetylmuramic acid kinase [Pseudomonadota bacterium]